MSSGKIEESRLNRILYFSSYYISFILGYIVLWSFAFIYNQRNSIISRAEAKHDFLVILLIIITVYMVILIIFLTFRLTCFFLLVITSAVTWTLSRRRDSVFVFLMLLLKVEKLLQQNDKANASRHSCQLQAGIGRPNLPVFR